MGRRNKKGRKLHGILLLDKPAGGSSNKVLQRVKRLYDAQKAGHTGTLDPLATGMLPICFGEATKLSGYLLDADKGYQTTLTLGVTTNSADADGDVLQTRAVPDSLDRAAFEAVCAHFVGEQSQIPPMVSAIKIDGKPLYKLAREGLEIERKPRHVVISQLDVLDFDGLQATLSVRCSKGTYIRSLVSDIGERIGCGAHVAKLRRVFVSPFEALPMWNESQIEAADDADALILPMDVGLKHLSHCVLSAEQCTHFYQGRQISGDFADSHAPVIGEDCRVYDAQSAFLGIATFVGGNLAAPKRVLQLN